MAEAPATRIVFGLKELPEDGTPLIHRHIMFGHAYKGQPAGRVLLAPLPRGRRHALRSGIPDRRGRPPRRRLRLLGGLCRRGGGAEGWAAQRAGAIAAPVGARGATPPPCAKPSPTPSAPTPAPDHRRAGRVGTGAGDLCDAMGLAVTRWDMAETAHGGPFPEVLEHEIFLNCILATPAFRSSCRPRRKPPPARLA
jgi:saccharopine dehydrogenase (NAD+, L-lysine-forming)